MNSSRSNLSVAVIGVMAVLVIAVGVQSFFLVKLYGESQKESKAEEVKENSTQALLTPAPSASDSVLPANPFDDDFFSGFGDDWHPFKEMERMREEMDQIFGRSLGRFQQLPGFDRGWLSSSFAPHADIEETEEEYVITMDVPGTDKANIDVSLEDGIITLKGTREEVNEEKEGDRVLRSERRQGSFQRSFALPGPVNEGSMMIDYSKGVLKVTVEKAK